MGLRFRRPMVALSREIFLNIQHLASIHRSPFPTKGPVERLYGFPPALGGTSNIGQQEVVVIDLVQYAHNRLPALAEHLERGPSPAVVRLDDYGSHHRAEVGGKVALAGRPSPFADRMSAVGAGIGSPESALQHIVERVERVSLASILQDSIPFVRLPIICP